MSKVHLKNVKLIIILFKFDLVTEDCWKIMLMKFKMSIEQYNFQNKHSICRSTEMHMAGKLIGKDNPQIIFHVLCLKICTLYQ